MHIDLRKSIAPAILLICYSGAIGAGEAPLEPSLKTVADAWSRRQAKAKTVRVVWRNSKIVTGLKERLQAFGKSRQGQSRSSEPPALSRSTLEKTASLCLDGDRFAYTYDERNTEKVNTPGFKVSLPSHYKSVLADVGFQTYTDSRSDPAVPDIESAVVTVEKPEDCDVPQFVDVRPLILALRPFSTKLSAIDLSTYRISPARGKIGDSSCLILEPNPSSNSGGKKFWVDPARDYIILRAVATQEGQAFVNIDINYDRDPVLGWVPKSWSVVQVGTTGNLKSTAQAGADQLSLNAPIPTEEFTVEKPNGALLNDTRTVPSISRRIGRDGPEPIDQSSGRLRVLLMVNIVFIAVIVALVVAYRHRRVKVN
jgi:hypothetical protein